MEFALVQDSSSYFQTLKSASGYLETASEDLQTIRTDMETKIERIHQEREVQLTAREKRIEGILDSRPNNNLKFHKFNL